MSKQQVEVSCSECDKEFEVDDEQSVATLITCPHCGNVHFVDTDWEGDEIFWYLRSV